MSLANYYTNKPVYQKVSRGRLDGILSLAGDLTGKRVLDIGCGAGEVGLELKRRGAALVHGLDLSPAAVNQASANLDGAALFDLAADTPWPELVIDQDYDLVIMSEVLEHLFKPEEALTKIRQQFNCPIIVSVPNILFWKNRLKILLGHFTYTNTGLMDRGHIHFFTWDSLQSMIKEVNLKINATAHHVPTRGTKILAKIWPGLFSYQFIIKLESVK